MVKTLRLYHLDFCFYDSGSSNKGHLSELWRESGVDVRIQGHEGRVSCQFVKQKMSALWFNCLYPVLKSVETSSLFSSHLVNCG